MSSTSSAKRGFRASALFGEITKRATRQRLFLSLLSVAAVALVLLVSATGTPTKTNALTTNSGYPRLANIQRLGGAEKYSLVVGKPYESGQVLKIKADLAAKGRSVTFARYFSPQAYQGEGMSMPVGETFAGHWLFAAGTKTTSAITSTATTIPVADASVFQGFVGYYLMIWDGNSVNGSLVPNNTAFWANAEHVKVTAVGSNSVTVQRGYNPSTKTFIPSAARSHANGSRIAMHLPGDGVGPDVWVYNQSTTSPRDGQGRQLNEALAAWLAQRYQHYFNKDTGVYQSYPGSWDALWFDATSYWSNRKWPHRLADVNNDLTVDGGVLVPGRSAWGEGLDVFFAETRQRLPGIPLVGGVAGTRGGAYLNGVEMEGFPGFAHSSNNYKMWSGSLATYQVWSDGASASPRINTVFTRIGTNRYPACSQYGNGADQGADSDFRFGLGTALLDDGYFAYTNGCFGDYWWDEYSVDLATGKAVPLSAGVDAVVANTGYLGQPISNAQRLKDPLAQGANLLAGKNPVTKGANGGAADLSVSGSQVTVSITNPGYQPSDLVLNYRPLSLVGGQEYSLSFWARADNGRMAIDLGRDVEVWVASGSGMWVGAPFVTDGWRQYVIDFVAPASSSNASVKFKLGGETGTVWLNDVQLHTGASDVFRRDFQNGIVIVNGSWQTQTVNLGGQFRKIDGNQNPGFNNGALVSSVTLNAHDAIILLRTSTSAMPEASASPTPSPSTPAPTSTPNPPSNAPDLMETAVSDPPSAIRIGETFDVTGSTANTGEATATDSMTRYFLSVDQGRDGADRILNVGRPVSSLAPSASSSGTITVKVPVDMPLGSYYLLACSDNGGAVPESDEGNNCRSSGGTLRVKAPNLKVTAIASVTTSGVRGSTIDIQETTKNAGDEIAGQSYTRYYLSQNGLKDGHDDAPLWGKRQVADLAPGAISSGIATVTIPRSSPTGDYFVLACADDRGEVKEADEEDNCYRSSSTVRIQ